MSTRVASHAGSWYDNRSGVLSKQLQGWLDEAKLTPAETDQPVKAIIAPSAHQPGTTQHRPHPSLLTCSTSHPLLPLDPPSPSALSPLLCSHAGYSYSGPTAAYAYRHLDPSVIRRVFILGPSHHHYTKQPELSTHSSYATPLGPLPLDLPLIASLKSSAPSLFTSMSVSVDEEEHSIEMHLPYIAHLYPPPLIPPTIIPLLIGALTPGTEAQLATLLIPHLLTPSTFFVVSSDFCHWGARFSYQPYDRTQGAGGKVWESIERMDREGMALVETVDRAGWVAYLTRTRNTVCGRYPIGVLVAMMERARGEGVGVGVKWVRYAQSSRVERMTDSSVSYASAIVHIADQGKQRGREDGKIDH